jgi:hypothetical protein
LIAFPRPTHVYGPISCSAGLGGYGHEGLPWQYYLPDNLKFGASDNFLKHLAALITLRMDILTGWFKESDHTLSMTYSATSEEWLSFVKILRFGHCRYLEVPTMAKA